MTAEITPITRIALSPDAFGATVDREAMVMTIGTGNYFVLNDIGASIWDLLAAQPAITFEELVARLERRYAAADGAIERDARSFLAALVDRKLLMVR